MEVVELVVGTVERLGHLGIALEVGGGAGPPHLDTDPPHLLDEATDAGRELTRQTACGGLGDVLGEVVAALELGDDPQDGEQEPEVACHRRLEGELVLHQVLDVVVQRVDQLVLGDDFLRRVAITRQEGVGRLGQSLGDQGEQLHHLVVDRLQVAMEGESELFGHGRSSWFWWSSSANDGPGWRWW